MLYRFHTLLSWIPHTSTMESTTFHMDSTHFYHGFHTLPPWNPQLSTWIPHHPIWIPHTSTMDSTLFHHGTQNFQIAFHTLLSTFQHTPNIKSTPIYLTITYKNNI